MFHVPGADADAKAGDRNYLMLAKPMRDWAYSKNIWSKFTKAGKAASAGREWLQKKGL